VALIESPRNKSPRLKQWRNRLKNLWISVAYSPIFAKAAYSLEPRHGQVAGIMGNLPRGDQTAGEC